MGFQHFNIKGTSVYLGGLYNLGFFGFLFFVLYLLQNILKNTRKLKLIFLLIPVFFSNIAIVQIIFIFYQYFLFSICSKKLNESILLINDYLGGAENIFEQIENRNQKTKRFEFLFWVKRIQTFGVRWSHKIFKLNI